MRIGVVGATGMIGNHTARAVLAAGHTLVVIHRPGSALSRLEDLPFEGRIADLDDPASLHMAFRGLHAVINCGAYYPTRPRPLLAEVEQATRQMHDFLDACRDNKVEKIVYVGSAVAIPPGSKDESAIYMQSPPDKNAYIQVKWAMDKIARERAEEEGIPIVIAIPTMTLGEYDYTPTTGRFLLAVARRSLPAYIEADRNVVYAGDVARGLVLAAEKGRTGERYLLGGTNITMTSLIQIAAEEAGVAAPSRTISLALAKKLALLDVLRYRIIRGKVPMLETAVATLAVGRFFETDKAFRELTYTPTLDVRHTIRRTLAWFREQGMLP